MKKESMIGRRLYAFVIDAFIFIALTFLIDGLVSTPINKAVTNIEQVYESFNVHNDRYNDLSVQYGIYFEDANGDLKFNEKVTPEQENAFFADPEVKELRTLLESESNELIVNFVVRVIISMTVTSFIVFYVVPLCIRRGRTVGKLIAKLNIVSKDYSYITWYKLLLRYLVSTITNIFLFIGTLGIVPLILLIVTINSKENQNIYDKLVKVYVIDGKIPANILKEQTDEEKENN